MRVAEAGSQGIAFVQLVSNEDCDSTSVDFAAKKLVLFFAGRGMTAHRTANQRGDPQSDENSRQVTAQLRQMCDQFMHIQEAHSSSQGLGHLKRFSGFLHRGRNCQPCWQNFGGMKITF